MLSLAIIKPPRAQSDKINDSTHCGEFNSLGGHKMLKEHRIGAARLRKRSILKRLLGPTRAPESNKGIIRPTSQSR